MSCPTPILIPRYRMTPQGRELWKQEIVPCGHCLACRIDKRNEWTWRLQAEIAHKDAIFCTLTIDDDNMLFPATVKKESIQRFLKRLRKGLDGRKIKYFFVSEYGDTANTFRPHYHGIIIGLSCGRPLTREVGDIPLIKKCWPFGFVDVKPASKGSIRYCLKYLDKQQDIDAFKKTYPSLEPPFRLMSKGIGAEWIAENAQQLREGQGSFYFDGANRPLPRYYKEKLFTDDELAKIRKGYFSNWRRARKLEKMRKEAESKGEFFDVLGALHAIGEQELVDLRAKCNVGGKSIKK